MIERIYETDVWNFLKEASLPILLYGMGNGADMIIDVFEQRGIVYADTFASDGFVRGHFFHGKRVISYTEALEKYGDFIIVMTFAVHDEAMLKHIKELSQKHIFLSPTVPIAGKGLFTSKYIKEHDEEFDKAYNILADSKSKQTFLDVLNFKVSGKTDYLFSCQSQKDEIYNNILKLNESEIIVDLGAYDGDTIREFLSFTNGKYQSITAFEPDEKNFRKLERKTAGLERIERFNLGAWDKEETLYFQKKAGRNSRQDENGVPIKFNSVDNIVKGGVSFIKMDIEGAELNALEGAKETIKRHKPKLYVCAYHRNEDFFTLPFKIKELCSDYKIYLRHHPYVPAWESNFYAVID